MGVASVTGHIGALGEPTVSADHGLGDQVLGADGNQYIYGVAGDAVAVGTCTYTVATGTITDAVGLHTAPSAIAAGSHGWVRLTTGIHG